MYHQKFFDTDGFAVWIEGNGGQLKDSNIDVHVNIWISLNKTIITCSVSENYDIKDRECYKIRQLEKDLYEKYVPKNFNCRNVIAYQWLMENKKHYNFNINLAQESISTKTAIIYIALVIIFSAIGSFLYDVSSSYFSYLLGGLMCFIVGLSCGNHYSKSKNITSCRKTNMNSSDNYNKHRF